MMEMSSIISFLILKVMEEPGATIMLSKNWSF